MTLGLLSSCTKTVWPVTDAPLQNSKLEQSLVICCLQAEGWAKSKTGDVTSVLPRQQSSPQQLFSTPTTTRAAKHWGTSLSPNTEAELDYLLSPTNLPPSPPSPACTGTGHCPAPDSKANLPASPMHTPTTSCRLASCEITSAVQAKHLDELLAMFGGPSATPSSQVNEDRTLSCCCLCH